MAVATNDEILTAMVPIIEGGGVTGKSEEYIKSILILNTSLTQFTNLDAESNEIIRQTEDAFGVPIPASDQEKKY